MKKGISISVLIFSLFILIGCSPSETASDSINNAANAEVKWYEGGSLHSATALEWQSASHENKLATAGDFIATAYSRESFNPRMMRRINNMNDMKYFAEELVRELDDATQPDDDPEANERMYANQTISSMASMIMVIAGWIE